MPEEEILKERERIKAKIIGAQTKLIESRQELKSRISKRRIPLNRLNRFVEYILFWIDNPDYVRIKNRTPEQNPTPHTQDF